MRYPTITLSNCRELAEKMVEGLAPSVDVVVDWVGEGSEVDLRPVAEVGRGVAREATEWTDPDRDRFEGKVSEGLYLTLSVLPTEVLDDRGFWRYLALRHFWDFIAWREESPFARRNHLKYLDGESSTESVLTRMYLRASAIRQEDRMFLAGGLPHSTDFWRSHILRVRTGSAPSLARAFVSKQLDGRLMTDPIRDVARCLNRVWTNVVLYMYDDSEASTLVDELWPSSTDD